MEREVLHTLELHPLRRGRARVEELVKMLEVVPFIQGLQSTVLRRYCCRSLRAQTAAKGQVVSGVPAESFGVPSYGICL